MTTVQMKPLARDLLEWFEKAARKMPWRESGNPYFIWVSEIMLQQTQVATVTPYFNRFMKRFPTVEALALAPLDDVLKHWEGLGYYSRARNLHKGARYVVEHFGGRVPRTPEAIREIPGIGPYSAGAILSIAYNVAEPAVDGNVIRVFSRLFAINHAFDKVKPKRELETLVRSYIPVHAAGDFNQAVMELGALVCRPKNPDCRGCPLNQHCQAFAAGNPTDYPVKGKKTKVLPVTLHVAWLVNQSQQVLLMQQRQQDIFQGLWCLPFVKAAESDQEAFQQLAERLPVTASYQGPLTEVSHTLTHRQLTLKVGVYTLAKTSETPEALPDVLPEGWEWVSVNAPELAVPVAYQKVFRFVEQHPLLMLMQ